MSANRRQVPSVFPNYWGLIDPRTSTPWLANGLSRSATRSVLLAAGERTTHREHLLRGETGAEVDLLALDLDLVAR